MARPLLEQRFKLKYHLEPREVSGLALVVGKKGPKLTRSAGGSDTFSADGGVLRGHNVPLSRLAGLLSSVMRRPVTDATGLEGTYDFLLDSKPYRGNGPVDLPSMMITATEEELGLKLESRRFEIQVMVIDHIELPDEN